MLLLLQPWENLPTSFRSPVMWLSVVFFSNHFYLWTMSSFRMQEYLGQLRSHNPFTAWKSSLKEPTAKSPYLLQRQRKSCLWFLWSQGSASSQNITPRPAPLCWRQGKRSSCGFSHQACVWLFNLKAGVFSTSGCDSREYDRWPTAEDSLTQPLPTSISTQTLNLALREDWAKSHEFQPGPS